MRLHIRTLIFTKKILTTGGRKLVYWSLSLVALSVPGPRLSARPGSARPPAPNVVREPLVIFGVTCPA